MIHNLVSRLFPDRSTKEDNAPAPTKERGIECPKSWQSFSSWNQISYQTKAPPIAMGALQGQHVYLRAPQKGDCEQWLSVRRQSADFLKPWEPVWPQDDLTPKGYQRRLNQYQKDARDGRSLPYFLFSTHTNQLLGGITLSNIRRGVCQSAMLGYWMGQSHAGKGLMFEAMAMLLPHLFDQYALHRIEAACLPHNQRSIALLQYLGFQHEGFARQYLCINGRWEDHQLFAILASDKRQ